ncbi:MAG: hypothetical protein QOD76_245 [Solirubrobacteraceae bacterium]|nr:hypothetical protein [Solirubrobacteraceae bacterium]
MTVAHAVLGLLVTGLFAAAGALGGWRWYRVEHSRAFWLLLRAGQAVLLLEVLDGGLLLALGKSPADDLHYVYGLLPLAVSFIAEQLRVAAAETVLAARGLESAQAVGRLPEADQRSVVTAIVRRELGVAALGALVITALLLRAAFGVGGF